jgi:serine protease AprX
MSRPIAFLKPLVLMVCALALTAAAVLAQAPAHRARLSRDLQEHLDAGSASVDIIVRGDRASLEELAARYGARARRWLATGGVLRVDATQLKALSEDPAVEKLSGDVAVHSSMAVTNDAIGADLLWQGLGGRGPLTGRGVGIAVVDSGIARVPAIRDRIVATVDFTASGGNGADEYGHGTHVAGILAAAAPAGDQPLVTERTAGVAPGAHLVNLRVLAADGSGQVSDVIRAVEWAVENRHRYGIRVINLSLGHPVFEPVDDDPLCEAVERAVRAGLVVVAAAGNLGKTPDGKLVVGGIESPGNSPFAITVGALNTKQTPQRSDDVLATYSSRGPTLFDFGLKPDLVAPGNRIVSLEAPGSYLAIALDRVHPTGWQDPEFLQTLRANATPFTLGTGQSMALALRLMKP